MLLEQLDAGEADQYVSELREGHMLNITKRGGRARFRGDGL
jgi:hypothetical protein